MNNYIILFFLLTTLGIVKANNPQDAYPYINTEGLCTWWGDTVAEPAQDYPDCDLTAIGSGDGLEGYRLLWSYERFGDTLEWKTQETKDLIDSMTTGIKIVWDDCHWVFIPKSKIDANEPGCTSIFQGAVDDTQRRLFHYESSGCTNTGLDYSILNLPPTSSGGILHDYVFLVTESSSDWAYRVGVRWHNGCTNCGYYMYNEAGLASVYIL